MILRTFVIVLSLFMICAVVQAQDVVVKGLVSFWTFDSKDINGNTAKDIAGNNDGEMTNTEAVAGKIGDALSFNGTSSMVNVPDDPSLDLTDAISVDAWIKLAVWDRAGRHIILSNYSNATADASQIQFAVKTDVGLSIFLRKAGGYNESSIGKTEDWVDQWVHVGVTWSKDDDGVQRLYVNGEEPTAYEWQQDSKDEINPGTLPLTIGAMPEDGTRFFSGLIDEVRIYNRRLTPAEMKQNFNAKSNTLAVESSGKLATVWGEVKGL